MRAAPLRPSRAHSPARFEIQVDPAARHVRPQRRPRRNSSSIGSISGEWKACETASGWVVQPASRRGASRSRPPRRPAPAMTTLSGALTRRDATRWRRACGDTRASRAEVALHRHHHAARRAAPASAGRARRSGAAPSSSRSTPATPAAANSPTLWPMTTRRARCPSCATARPARTRARTAPAACSRSGRAAPPVLGRTAARAAARSSSGSSSGGAAVERRRGTPARCRRARGPCPTYCAPWPVNRNATRGARRAPPGRDGAAPSPAATAAQLRGHAARRRRPSAPGDA